MLPVAYLNFHANRKFLLKIILNGNRSVIHEFKAKALVYMNWYALIS